MEGIKKIFSTVIKIKTKRKSVYLRLVLNGQEYCSS